MKVKLLSNRGINGESKKKGDVVEVSDKDGRYLVSSGKAEKAEKKVDK